MKRYIVTTTLEVDADTAEGAAFLMYEHLTNKPAPLDYRVEDQEGALDVRLEQSTADLFARLDHTADPLVKNVFRARSKKNHLRSV